MDPLSIAASIAGVATAGAAVTSALYTLVSTVRNAPKEMHDIAAEMTNLTSVLEYLHGIIADKDRPRITRPRFISVLEQVIGNIRKTQDEIKTMIDDKSIIMKLIRWATKSQRLLSDIRNHKTTLTLQVTILNLAITTRAARTERSPLPVSSGTRLRKEAENLVQAGKVCLKRLEDDKETYERTYRHPLAPRERAPSPPVRTSHQHPSTIDYEREDFRDRLQPGKATAMSGTTLAFRPPPPPPPPAQVPVRRSHIATVSDADTSSADERDHVRVRRPSAGANLGGTDKEGNLNNRVAHFDAGLSVQGDAATLLYNLIFAPESATKRKPPTSRPEERDASGDANSNAAEITDDSVESVRLSSDDSDSDSYASTDRSSETERNGARRHRVIHQIQTTTHQPVAVVSRLLLEWTTLTMTEVNETRALSAPGEGGWGGQDIQKKLAEIADQINNGDRFDRRDSPGMIPPYPEYPAGVNSAFKPKPRPNYNSWKPPNDTTGRSPPSTHYSDDDMRSESTRFGNDPWDELPPRNPFPSRNRTRDIPSWASKINTDQTRNGMKPRQTGRYGPGAPRRVTVTVDNDSVDGSMRSSRPSLWQGSHTEEDQEEDGRLPKILVLPTAEGIDVGNGPQIPRIDAADHGFTIRRQGSDDAWMTADQFRLAHDLKEKAVLASLLGDKSSLPNPNLWDVMCEEGANRILYMRGSDLGETWFLETKPWFVTFYHHSYLPQYHPAQGDPTLLSNLQEYVAIGGEWASEEAMEELGIIPKDRKDGRIYLDATTTYSELLTLANLTHRLRMAKQRRQYRNTFYKPVDVFRQIHGINKAQSLSERGSYAPEPLAKSPEIPQVMPTPTAATQFVPKPKGDGSMEKAEADQTSITTPSSESATLYAPTSVTTENPDFPEKTASTPVSKGRDPGSERDQQMGRERHSPSIREGDDGRDRRRAERDRDRNRDRSPRTERDQSQDDDQSLSSSRRRRRRRRSHRSRDPSPNFSETKSHRSAGSSSRRSRYEPSIVQDDSRQRARQRRDDEEEEKRGDNVTGTTQRDSMSGIGGLLSRLRGK